MGQQQQGLLLAATAGGEVELYLLTGAVGHRDLTALRDVLGLIQRGPEQGLDVLDDALPLGLAVFANQYLVTEITQHFRCSPFTDADADGTTIDRVSLAARPDIGGR